MTAVTALALGVFGAALGCVIGSFSATLALRWPDVRSLIHGRSRCDHCGLFIPPASLIPLWSYCAQAGRARCCGNLIHEMHPMAELLATAIGFASLFLFGVAGLQVALFGWLLLTLALLDLRHYILPHWLTAALLFAGLARGFVSSSVDFSDRLAGLAAGFLCLTILRWCYRRLRGRDGLGGGDAKLLGAIGAWTGWQLLPTIMVAAGILGLLTAGMMRLRGRAIAADTRLPLGTFLAVVSWPIWLWSQA